MAARPGAENHTRTAQPPELKEPPALFILFYAVIVQLSQLEAST